MARGTRRTGGLGADERFTNYAADHTLAILSLRRSRCGRAAARRQARLPGPPAPTVDQTFGLSWGWRLGAFMLECVLCCSPWPGLDGLEPRGVGPWQTPGNRS